MVIIKNKLISTVSTTSTSKMFTWWIICPQRITKVNKTAYIIIYLFLLIYLREGSPRGAGDFARRAPDTIVPSAHYWSTRAGLAFHIVEKKTLGTSVKKWPSKIKINLRTSRLHCFSLFFLWKFKYFDHNWDCYWFGPVLMMHFFTKLSNSLLNSQFLY